DGRPSAVLDRPIGSAVGYARDEGVRGDAARTELCPCRRQGRRQSGDRVGRGGRGELLGSVDPLPRVGPVVVGLLGTTIMDPAAFRLATLTQFAKRRLEPVPMELPEVVGQGDGQSSPPSKISFSV